MKSKNYQYGATFLAIALVFSMVRLETVLANDKTVITNTVSASHSTGGQSTNGADGADGAPGRDGSPGQDGASVSSTGTGTSKAEITTTVDGNVVTQVERTTASESGIATTRSSIVATSTTLSSTTVHTHTEAGSEQELRQERPFSLTAALLSLRVTLINYVTQLF